jgi:hypothetical protein
VTSNDKIKILSGLIMGEGWIGMKKAKAGGRSISPVYSVAMTITNTNSKLISWCIENFGGNFYKNRSGNEKHKDAYTWQIQNNKLYPLLKKVLPYLVIKDEQAKIVLNYLEHKLIDPSTSGRGNRLSDRELSFREYNYSSLKKLNQKGPLESVTTNTPDNSFGLKIESELYSNVENLIGDNRIA